MKASYLLRFDDLCPTMDHGKWAAIQAILDRHAVKAMLAVVPNNRHPALMVDREDQDFWERMRVLQDRGWAIALHGLTHLYTQRAVSLVVPGEAESEFAGLPTEIQCEKNQARDGNAGGKGNSSAASGLRPIIPLIERPCLPLNRVASLVFPRAHHSTLLLKMEFSGCLNRSGSVEKCRSGSGQCVCTPTP